MIINTSTLIFYIQWNDLTHLKKTLFNLKTIIYVCVVSNNSDLLEV